MKRNQKFKLNLERGEEVTVKSKNFTVTFSYIGEGCDGDYNSEDENDKKLLRCDISYNKEIDECIRNGSFCTQISTDVKEEALLKFMEDMSAELEKFLAKLGSDEMGRIGHLMGFYSWCESDENGDIIISKNVVKCDDI